MEAKFSFDMHIVAVVTGAGSLFEGIPFLSL